MSVIHGTMGASPSIGALGSVESGSGGSGSGDGDYLSVMPRVSTSVNSIYSDVDLELVTSGSGPCAGSGWPDAIVVCGFGFDDVDRTEGGGPGVVVRTRRGRRIV